MNASEKNVVLRLNEHKKNPSNPWRLSVKLHGGSHVPSQHFIGPARIS